MINLIGNNKYIKKKINVNGLFGITIVITLLFISIFSDLISPYNPIEMHRGDEFLAPSTKYFFGTDQFGRDILSRIIHGGKVSLFIGFISILISSFIGVITGLVSGYFKGFVDTIIMRLCDVLLAFPTIFMGIAMAALLGPGLINTSISIAIIKMPFFSRIARSVMLTEKEKLYVDALKAFGANKFRIIIINILPNCMPAILAQMSIALPQAILIEAALSFLGLGVQPPIPSWGVMLKDSHDFIYKSIWYGFFPGLVLFIFVLGLFLMSNYIRDLLDPKNNQIL